jgi:DNA invertase Pin-like site-specific DNA recombinase
MHGLRHLYAQKSYEKLTGWKAPVLVTDLSRLSRSQGDLSKMIDRFMAKGVRVIGAQDGYDSAR